MVSSQELFPICHSERSEVFMRSKDELVEAARLAKLSLDSEELSSLFDGISDIMNVVESINDVDLSKFDCSEETTVSELREDDVKPSLAVDSILSNAAEKQDDFFIA